MFIRFRVCSVQEILRVVGLLGLVCFSVYKVYRVSVSSSLSASAVPQACLRESL